MPYGGEDVERQNFYKMIFQLFIKQPAEEMGYVVVREDFSKDGGDVAANIIEHLAEDDLVIADLSGANWNVAYELGIRHAMVKGKTVLLCDSNAESRGKKFDVYGLQTILYTQDDIASDLTRVQDEVKATIRNREESTKADNTLHRQYPRLIDFSYKYATEENALPLQREIAQLQERVEQLTGENERLRDRMKKEGISADEQETLDIAAQIDKALQSVRYSGDQLVLAMRQYMEESELDYQAIGELLNKGLTEGVLAESHFRKLYYLFRNRIPQLTEVVLKVAESRYPMSLDFKSYLADFYSDNYQTFDKALKYANEVLQVSIVDEQYVSTCKKIDNDQLAACFNAYIGLGRYDIIRQIAPQLLTQLPTNSKDLVLRNLAGAYREEGNVQDEEKILTQLLEEFPMSDVNHYRAGAFFLRQGQYRQAYYQLEIAAALDENDPDYLRTLAGIIIDEAFARTERICTNINKADAILYAIPFLMRMMQISSTRETLTTVMDFLLRNRLTVYQEKFEEWISNGMEEHGIEGLRYEAVDYIDHLSQHLSKDVCQQMKISE